MGPSVALKTRISRRVEQVREQIEQAALRSGRTAAQIRLMAVTKLQPAEAVAAAADAGITLFGENRVQEAAGKYASLDPGLDLHLIGHLQRNKAKTAAGLFTCVQSIDRLDTAQALNRGAADRGRVIDILLEVNTSAEESKSGYRSGEGLFADLDRLSELTSLRLRGLMTIAPFTSEAAPVRRAFAELRALFERVAQRTGSDAFDTLSMGMSGDFVAAIEEGSTLVRIGTAIFGERS